MAVEVVLMAPVLVLFMLMVVAFGRLVWVRGQVEAASRDAVRSASIARSPGEARDNALATANEQLDGRATCQAPAFAGNFAAGGVITVTLTCEVSYAELGLLGLGGGTTVTAESSAPIDLYRRTDEGGL
jgi:Flp pilus assembly protein TadG